MLHCIFSDSDVIFSDVFFIIEKRKYLKIEKKLNDAMLFHERKKNEEVKYTSTYILLLNLTLNSSIDQNNMFVEFLKDVEK